MQISVGAPRASPDKHEVCQPAAQEASNALSCPLVHTEVSNVRRAVYSNLRVSIKSIVVISSTSSSSFSFITYCHYPRYCGYRGVYIK